MIYNGDGYEHRSGDNRFDYGGITCVYCKNTVHCMFQHEGNYHICEWEYTAQQVFGSDLPRFKSEYVTTSNIVDKYCVEVASHDKTSKSTISRDISKIVDYSVHYNVCELKELHLAIGEAML